MKQYRRKRDGLVFDYILKVPRAQYPHILRGPYGEITITSTELWADFERVQPGEA